VSVGSPKNQIHYKKLDCDGLNVFLDKKAKIQGTGLDISLKGLAFFKELQVSGIK